MLGVANEIASIPNDNIIDPITSHQQTAPGDNHRTSFGGICLQCQFATLVRHCVGAHEHPEPQTYYDIVRPQANYTIHHII